MEDTFQVALKEYRAKIGEHLEQSLANVPEAQRALLIALAPEAIQGLHAAMYTGPDRLGAIKLVLQMTGLVKDGKKGSQDNSASPP
jgi:hypothetical protein